MAFECLDLDDLVGFEWDAGNIYKNEKKHGVHWQEIEEVFFNRPLLTREDTDHLERESRCFVLGVTDSGKLMFVAFTKRNNKIRVISARPMSRKERVVYEAFKKNTEIQ